MTTAVDTSQRSDLAIEGMTCAACANRIQRGLGKLDTVADAQVNFATGKATVRHSVDADADDFRAVVEKLGYHLVDVEDIDAAEAKRQRVLGLRLAVALSLAVPVMLISMVMPLRFDGWEWVVGALSTVVIFWSGWPFHRAAATNAVHGTTTMDTLVSIGSTSAWLWSAVVLVADIDADIYFETGAVIVALILLGKWLEARAKRRSGDAIRALAGLGAKTAHLEDGTEIPIADLDVGMRFLVRPAEKVATDGIVVSGTSAIDTSMVTGEPVPVDIGPGEEIVGATVNANGSLVVEATRVGSDTALAQIIRLVDQAQGSRADVQRLADRVAAVFVPTAIVIAVGTLVGWLLVGESTSDAFTAAVAVLIIACPCALGLATPLGIMVGTGRGAQLGVIIKGGEVLEDTRAVDAIVVDKTGTVTEGRMRVAHIDAPGIDQASLVPLVASLESRSEHPIAQAIATTSADHRTVTGFENHVGRGVIGDVGGVEVRVGRRSLFDRVPDAVESAATSAEATGATAVLAGRDGDAEAVFVITDTIRPTSVAAIEAFHDLGMSVTLLTGDNATTAHTVADAVGIDQVRAEVLPDDKAAEIRRLQETGARVAMVGDGINDAPALAQADLGIAIGTGTDVAIEASDLTLVSGDLRAAADAIALARRTLSTIKGNLFWAFAYNAAAIPLAALGILNPMIAAGAMGLSSLFVVSNSLRLRRFRGYRQSRHHVSIRTPQGAATS